MKKIFFASFLIQSICSQIIKMDLIRNKVPNTKYRRALATYD